MPDEVTQASWKMCGHVRAELDGAVNSRSVMSENRHSEVTTFNPAKLWPGAH